MKWADKNAAVSLAILVLLVLLLAIGSLAVFSMRLVEDFGAGTATRNEENIRALTESFLVRLTQERAERCGQFFRRAETVSAELAQLAASFIANIDFYGRENLNPDERFEGNSHNGYLSNAATARANVLLCRDGRPLHDMTRHVNALSHMDPILEQAQRDNPSHLAAWLLRDFGDGSTGFVRNYPNTHYVERLPPLEILSPFEAPYYVIATPRLNPERQPKWSEVYEDDTGNGLVMTVAAPMYDADAFLGVAGLDLSLDGVLAQALDNASATESPDGFPTEFSFLVKTSGQLVAAPPAQIARLGLGPARTRPLKPAEILALRLDSSSEPSVRALADVLRRERFGARPMTLGQDRYLVAFSRLPSTEWTLGVAVAESDYLGSVRETSAALGAAQGGLLTRFIGGSSAACAAVTAIILLFFRINLLGPLRTLITAMRRVSAGDWRQAPALPVAPYELGELVGAFRVMTESLRDSRARIEAAERQYRGLFENAFEGIFKIDHAGRFVSANRSLARMLGFESPDDLPAIHQILAERGARPEDHAALWTQLREQGRVEGYETSFRRPDGGTTWLCLSARAVREGRDGATGFEGMLLDVTERKEKEAAEGARLAAEQASQAKSAFMANMSHEIRTPLNGILGMTELTQMTCPDPQAQEYLRHLSQSAQSLLDIVNDILDLSKIEAGKVDVARDRFDLTELVESTLQPLLSLASAKGLRLSRAVSAEGVGDLVGDPGRIRQILTNLVGNALKFTPHGAVEVLASVEKAPQDGVTLLFVIKDDGIGVAAENLARIFEPFSQAGGSAHAKYGGTGLGLAISKQLAEAMGGRIWVNSQVGKGSTFYFTVETELAPAEQAPPRPGPAVTYGYGRGLRALLAEDNLVNRILAIELLRKRGFEVETAENGRGALEKLRLAPFDFVLMDVRMPEMDGLETTRRIRAGEAGDPTIPIIALTAHALRGDRESFLDAGMDDYVSKPLDMEEIYKALTRVMGVRPGRG